MRDANKITLIGQLKFDVESHNDAVSSFKLVTKESWKDKKSGEDKFRLEYHRVVCFGPLADQAKSLFEKGDRALVMGTVRSNSYKDKEGIERRSTEIIASNVELLTAVKQAQNESDEQMENTNY